MGGSAFPQTGAPLANRLVMGGGGGAGDLNGGGAEPVNESAGATGGGLVFFSSGIVSGTARINADGAAGQVGQCDGGGGGGAGGSIRVVVGSGAGNVQASAVGGAGGAQNGCPNHGSAGGGGGGGVVLSNAALGTAVVGSGAAGIDISGGVWNGESGVPGQTSAAASTAFPGMSPGYLCLPAVSVTKTALTPSVTAATSATALYRITASNPATSGAARNVELLDITLPPGWAYLAANTVTYTPAPPAAAGSFATGADTTLDGAGYSVGSALASAPTAGNNSLSWGSFFLAPGGQIDISFTVSIPDTATVGTYHNPAGVRFKDPTTNTTQKVTPATANGSNRTASTYGSAGVCTTVGACNYASGTAVAGSNHNGLEAGPATDDVVLPVDWAVGKTQVGTAVAGQTVGYTISPRNAGRAIAAQSFATSQASTVLASNVPASYTSSPLRVTDTLPAGSTLSGLATGTNWTCSGAGPSLLVCDYFAATPASAYPVAALGSLPIITLTLAALPQSLCPGPLVNTATISLGALELQSANNTTSTSAPLSCSANISITKTNNVTSLQAGSTTSYTLTMANLGPSSANGALVQDVASAGLVCTALACNPLSATGGATCPSPLTLSLLQSPPGLPIPSFPANSSVTLNLTCNVTATGLP